MTVNSHDDFDDRLTRALRASPWSDAAADLAERAAGMAIERERAACILRERLARHRRRAWLLNLAAAFVIAVISLGLLTKLSWGDGTPEAMAIEAEVVEPMELPDEAALLLICGGLLLAALVWVTVSPTEQSAVPAA